MATVCALRGLEVLDSRGHPTVKATCDLASGARGAASVPSGASTGAAEAIERRDGEVHRYHGLGCRQAVRHIDEDLARAIVGRAFSSQQAWDEALVACDGTERKARLGANAILACSLAFARWRSPRFSLDGTYGQTYARPTHRSKFRPDFRGRSPSVRRRRASW